MADQAHELVVPMTRGTQDDFIPGVVIAGSSVMHERIRAGAATLSF